MSNSLRTKNQRSIDRLYEFAVWCKTYNMVKSLNDWETLCGIGNRYLSNTLQSNKGSVGAEILRNVYRKFPIVNLTWVITGEGEMITAEKQIASDSEKLIELKEQIRIEEDKIVNLIARREEIERNLTDYDRLIDLADDMRKVLKKIPR